MAEEDLRAQLQRVALRRRLATAEQDAATAELKTTILQAQGAGIPVVEIARLVDLSRQRIYKLLADDDD